LVLKVFRFDFQRTQRESSTMKHERPPSTPVIACSHPIVRHAVFPVAGFGASFLPATKACPKEMLPVVDKPLIQYAVEEAAAAGLTHMIFVTGRSKRAIEDHFDHAYELERELAARDDADALSALRSAIPPGVTFSYVRQPDAAGVTDALRRVRSLVGDEPFAVVLQDQLIDAPRPALAQLLDVFDEQRVSIVGAERADLAEADATCLIGADLRTSALRAARALVKVPPIGAVSAPLTAAGRFVFTAAVWNVLAAPKPPSQAPSLVAVTRALMERERVFACLIDGRRFDCGSKLGYLEAQFAFAQKRSDLWNGLQQRLADLLVHEGGSPDRATTAALTGTTTGSQLPTPGS
jgi:UTP--glucose-1-phosphate uridylyltransferase